MVLVPGLAQRIARGAFPHPRLSTHPRPLYFQKYHFSTEVKTMATKTRPDLGSRYRSGEKSPVSGAFVCVEDEQAGKEHKINVSEGKTFPQCEGSDATWRLVSYAPTA